MTIRQLPDFAFRSAGDYAAAMDDIHAATTRSWARPSSTSWSGCLSSRSSGRVWFSAGLTLLVVSIVVCTLDRTPRLWRGVADDPRRPAGAVLRPAAPGPRRDGRRGRGGRAGRPAAQRLPGPRGDRRRRHDVPLRRPPPVHEDGDAVHAHRACPVPGRGRRHLAARRRAGPGRPRGRIADGPADRDAGAAAGQEPRLRRARASIRDRPPTSRPTWPSTRTAARSRARRSGSTTRCRSAGYTFHQNGFGPAPYLDRQRCRRPAAVGWRRCR